MGVSKKLFEEAIVPNFIIDDQAASKFIAELKQREGKEEHIEIGYCELPADHFWEFDGDEYIEDGFSKMAKKKVVAISNLLQTLGIEQHVYSICSIIQIHCCREILVEIMQPTINRNTSFPKEFYSLYKLLANDVLEIKVSTSKKDETCTIKSQPLIKLLLNSFKESVLNLNDAVEYIYEIETNGLSTELPESKLLDSAIINLLIYLQRQTNCPFNSSIKDIQSVSFSNKQFELIYDLLVLGGIINDENIHSPSKDYIRVKVQRAISKKSSLLNCFLKKENDLSVKQPIVFFKIGEFAEEFKMEEKHKKHIADTIKKLFV